MNLKSWKELNKQREIRKDMREATTMEQKLLSCYKCDYQCIKENTLRKHRNIKHEPQASKVGEHKSPSMVHMLKYVADKHSKKSVQITDIKEQCIPKEYHEHKEVLKTLEYDKFKYYKCKKIF